MNTGKNAFILTTALIFGLYAAEGEWDPEIVHENNIQILQTGNFQDFTDTDGIF